MVTFDNANFPDPPPELVLQRGKPSSFNSFSKAPEPSLVGLAKRMAEFDNSFCKGSGSSSLAGLEKRTVAFDSANFPNPPPELVLQKGNPSSLISNATDHPP